MIDSVEIPTAILGVSTMSSSKKVFPVYFWLSVVVAITFFELAMIKNPRFAVENIVVLLLKLVGAFLPPSYSRVRKNRSAIYEGYGFVPII